MNALALAALLCLPSDGDRLEVARKLEAAGQHTAAISEYQKALEENPTQSGTWTELAETRLAAGQLAAAVGDFSRAVRLDPTGVRAQKGLAAAVEKSGNPQRALVEWRRAAQISQGPDQAEAEGRIQKILVSLGQAAPAPDTTKASAPTPEKAEKKAPPPTSAPKAVQVASSDPADVKKAVELWKGGKRDQALDILRGVIRKKPTAEAYYYAGVMRLEEKKHDMAEFNLRKATSDKEVGGSAWYWLGRSLEARGKAADAKAAFRKSVEMAPKGEFAAEARARLEEPKPIDKKAAAEPPKPVAPVHPETAPPPLPDSLRACYSWAAPDLRMPSGDGSAAGKMLDDAAHQNAQGNHDLALSTLDQIKIKQSSAPAADLVPLAAAVVYSGMGLPTNAIAQTQTFLKEHGNHPAADQARFVQGVAWLRAGRADSAAAVLGPLPVATKGSLWTESARQSALAEALRVSGKHAESVAALKLAFQAESEPRQRRNLALRMVLESNRANQPQQALEPLAEARKGCDRSNACLEMAVSEADLLWNAGKPDAAAAVYSEVLKDWPRSTEAPWAAYQCANASARTAKGDATAGWKGVIDKYPGSYWAAQARLRLEDAVWKTRYQEGK